MSVFSPWSRKWISKIYEDQSYLSVSSKPCKNPPTTRQEFQDLFSEPIPNAPSSHSLSETDQEKFSALWPAGEHAAQERLEEFCREKIQDYALFRSEPNLNAGSGLSVHLSQGTLSARSCIRHARASNVSGQLDGGKPGVVAWINEIGWRDFYRRIPSLPPADPDVLAAWPRVCKNKSFKADYDRIEWEDNDKHFNAWCDGRTGVPIVDAGMRQLNSTGWMHNRARMITASYLSKHLLIYWRRGERYFMEHLMDGDFASNNGGWQWTVGSGNDPCPWFRIFNPWLQSSKFDPSGDYIRRYVEELRSLPTSAIHAPHEKFTKDQLERLGYCEPALEHTFARHHTSLISR